MKLSLNWIRKYISLQPEVITDIEEILTVHTSEVEEVLHTKEFFKDLVVGQLLEIKDHPNSDKLTIGQFDCGSHGTKQIIYGSSLNLQKDQLCTIALPGATLASGITIGSSQLKDELSDGMVCIGSEIGMKFEGLPNIPTSAKPGTSFLELSEYFDDQIIDIDNKSLTHRPDLMGHKGFVREFSAITKTDYTFDTPEVAEGTASISVDIQTKDCRRFTALGIDNITVEPSPIGTQILLENLGVRTISNLVDVTNMVMNEFGQPMHVFDADKIDGGFIIRKAKAGESLVALDGETYELTEEDIVIADHSKVLSIAGIMGGLESSVTKETKNIIFESANFDATTIRKTSSRLGLRSDSSMRFEKTLDPQQCLEALKQASVHTLALCPEAEVISTITDNYPHPYPSKQISIHPDKIRKITGVKISNQEIIDILSRIGFVVEEKDNLFDVQIPSFRATKDVAIEEDIIEEVIRLYGFDNIPETLPELPLTPPTENKLRAFENGLRRFFSNNQILEHFGYSFVNENDKKLTLKEDYVTLANPLSSEHTLLRQTLLSNLVDGVESELRTQKALQLFEIGKIYTPIKDQVLPQEDLHFSLFNGAISKDENTLFYETKSLFEKLLQNKRVSYEFKPSTINTPHYAHPSKAADIFVEGEFIGHIFAIHPSYNTIKGASLIFLEVNLETLHTQIKNKEVLYTRVSEFPAINRDISVRVKKDELIGTIIDKIKETSQFISKVTLIDEYINEEKYGSEYPKNLAFNVHLQAPNKNLTKEELNEINTKLEAKIISFAAQYDGF